MCSQNWYRKLHNSLYICTYGYSCRCRCRYCPSYRACHFSGGEWQDGRSLAVGGQEESRSLCCSHSLLLRCYVHLCNLLNLTEISFSCLYSVFHSHSFYNTGRFKPYLWRKPLKVQSIISELMFIFRAVGFKVELRWCPRTLYVYMAHIKFFWLVAAASLMSHICRDSWLQEFSLKSDQKLVNFWPYIVWVF